jgi:lipopolysaccharide export system permease protein
LRLFDWYVGKQLLQTLLMVVMLLLGLELFFGLIQELKWVGKGTYTLGAAFAYLSMSLPTKLYQLLPWAACLGTLVGLGSLAEHSELIAIRAVGVSIFRISLSVLKALTVFVLLALAIGEGIAPYLEEMASARRTAAISGGQTLQTAYGVWTRHGDNFIHIQSIQPDGSLQGVTRYHFNADRHLASVSFANSARATRKGDWILNDIRETHFDKDSTRVVTRQQEILSQLLEPALLKTTGMKHPEYLSLKALWKNIKHRSKHGLSATAYWVAWWTKLLHPLAMMVMGFLAIPFVFGPLRKANMGQKLMVGFLLGFVFFTINKTVAPLAVVYPIPPVVAVAAPIVLFSAFGAYLIRRIRYG